MIVYIPYGQTLNDVLGLLSSFFTAAEFYGAVIPSDLHVLVNTSQYLKQGMSA